MARRVVHGLKFGRRLALAGVAADAMLHALPAHERPSERADEWDASLLAIVPVPPAPWRWGWRGFDPAEELASAVSCPTGLEHPHFRRRSRGRRQVGRRRVDRLSQPPNVRLAGEAPRRALLVDDVWTTGATLAACAAALCLGGCRRVVGLTLARAL